LTVHFRVETFNVFNHGQFSGYNLTTNVTNTAGKTGRAIFNNLTSLTVTNNLGAGSAAVIATDFGERNVANAMRVRQRSGCLTGPAGKF
jgi:hypothetical protein